MSESIDDLLAQMKAEFNPNMSSEKQVKPETSVNNSLSSKSQTTSPLNMNNSNFSSSMDQLLSEMKAELTEPKIKIECQQSINNSIKKELENLNNSPNQENIYSSNTSKPSQIHNYLLDDLKSELIAEQKQQLEAEKIQQQLQLENERKQAELKEKRKKQALTEKAKQWLKNLDPKSDEAIWFEEFSYGYETKIEAAIDYLEALREVHFS